MLPFRKILCPTDLSESSHDAVKAASELASHFGSELWLLHTVMPAPVTGAGMEPPPVDVALYDQELLSSAKKSLEEVIARLELQDLTAHLVVLIGDPADAVLRTAEENHPDLIVIATHGRTGLDHFVFGSVAEKVVRLSPCPVLTIRSSLAVQEAESADMNSAPGEEMSRKADTYLEKLAKKKMAYGEKAEAELREWGATIEILKAKADMSKIGVKVRYTKELEKLQSKQKEAKQKLQELRDSGGEAWTDVKEGMDRSLADLKKSLKSAISRFKENSEK